jgi:hypothetical protein
MNLGQCRRFVELDSRSRAGLSPEEKQDLEGLGVAAQLHLFSVERLYEEAASPDPDDAPAFPLYVQPWAVAEGRRTATEKDRARWPVEVVRLYFPGCQSGQGPVVTTCNAVIVQHCRRLAVLLAGDEELIAEIERRGYRVHCPEVPCPECFEMVAVPPGEAEVTCGFCGERVIRTTRWSSGEKQDSDNHRQATGRHH